jgi:hypothetical protein
MSQVETEMYWSVGFIGAAHVRLADDFDQRGAGTVEIDIGVFVGVLETVVDALAGVVFHVDARNADAFLHAVDFNVDPAMLGYRLIVLRNLVALGKIRVEIILTGEDGSRIHAAIQGQAGLNRQFDGLPAQHGKGSRQPQTDRADVGIGRSAETGRAATEDLGVGGELDVNFQADDRLVLFDYGSRARRHVFHYSGGYSRIRMAYEVLRFFMEQIFAHPTY